jgi:hypothetical protein
MVGFSAIVIAALTLLGTAPQALALSTLLNSPLAHADSTANVELSEVADLIGAGGLALVVGVLQFVLATTIVSGLLIVAVAAAVRGDPLPPGELWARCRRRLPGLLGLAVVVPLAAAVVLVAAMLPGMLVLFLLRLDALGVVLLVLGAILGVFLYIGLYLGWWAVAAPALLLEDLGVFASLRRSWRLVRRSFWRVFGIGLLTSVISYIVRQIFTLPFGIIGGLVAGTQGHIGFSGTLVQLLISDIGTILAGAVLYPFSAGVIALLYLDLRIRREGLDVDLMRP